MCKECRLTYCPEFCPGYAEDDRTPIGRCALCNEFIYDENKFAEANGELYCTDCLDELDTAALLYICNMSNIYELLHELGFEGVASKFKD